MHHSLGYRSITLIPYGQVGAIPSHLRAYANQQFNQYGIQVYHSTKQAAYPQKQSHKRKIKPEATVLDLLIDLLDED